MFQRSTDELFEGLAVFVEALDLGDLDADDLLLIGLEHAEEEVLPEHLLASLGDRARLRHQEATEGFVVLLLGEIDLEVLLDLVNRHPGISAKEIFAWLWRENEVGPIVGQRTQGACIGTGFRELMDGSILLVPFMDVRRFTGGETLEAVGVWPDVWVQQRPLPYRAGRDEILAEGLERVAAEVASVPR